LLNYLIFSAAFTQLARRQQATAYPTRTPQPTFEGVDVTPLAWKMLPTNTPYPTHAPILTPIAPMSATLVTSLPITAALQVTVTTPPSADTPLPLAVTAAPTSTSTPAPTGQAVIHVVKRGETLGTIAASYGVTAAAIIRANSIKNPNLIVTGTKLTIPVSGQTTPTSTPQPTQTPTNTPQPAQTQAPTNTPLPAKTGAPTSTPTHKPPTPKPTATAKPTSPGQQFTAELEWRPSVAPNCAGPGISSLSMVKDSAGNPVNGVVVEINCYGNRWPAIPSGKPGVYEAGHYDWSPGQSQPVDWVCTARVIEIGGQPVTSSQEVTIHFDTNDCRPGKSGHQVAIVNWTKWR
jgi:LysM repeat protein